jgi:hypothetical protein
MMKPFMFSEVFRNFTNITYQVKVWNELWLRPVPFEMGIYVHWNSNARIRASFTVYLGRSKFPDVLITAGHIHVNLNITRFSNVHNTQDCTVAFHGSTWNAVVKAGAMISIPISFSVPAAGRFERRYPVTTNLTPSFHLNISGTAVHPKLKFINEFGNSVGELSFEDRARSQTVFLTNLGKTNVTLDRVMLHRRLSR